MTSDIVWILEQSKGFLFTANGVSGSFMVPRANLNLDPADIASARMWIILRGTEDRLFKSVKIKKVERIVDGYYANDFVLSLDLISSFAAAKSYSSATSLRIAETEHLKSGISSIEPETVKALHASISKAIKIKLTPPPPRVLRELFIEPVPQNSRQLAEAALKIAVMNFSLDEVWANGLGDKLGPFANFAAALLLNQFSNAPDIKTVELLRSLDPVANPSNAGNSKWASSQEERFRAPPSVDTEFIIINPDTIRAREFVAGSKPRDLVAELKKTEHAEKTHQAILKDIAEFLIASELVPYESDSIDLMYGLNERTLIFEIKSANQENILAQAADGAFQLAFYYFEMETRYENIDSYLILQSVGNRELEDFIVKTLGRLSTQVLFYEAAKDWPERIVGLPLA